MLTSKHSSFTLIELLIVIAIIAILAAILLPALSRARMIGKRSSCLSNEKQIMLGMHQYTNDFNGEICQRMTIGANNNPWSQVLEKGKYTTSKTYRCPDAKDNTIAHGMIYFRSSTWYYHPTFPSNGGNLGAFIQTKALAAGSTTSSVVLFKKMLRPAKTWLTGESRIPLTQASGTSNGENAGRGLDTLHPRDSTGSLAIAFLGMPHGSVLLGFADGHVESLSLARAAGEYKVRYVAGQGMERIDTGVSLPNPWLL